MKKILIRLSILLVLLAAAGAAYFLYNRIPDEQPEQALATVQRGDLVVKSYLRGTLQAVRSTTLAAPNLGLLSQITQLAAPGSLARPKDLIAEFDDSDRRVFLADTLLDLEKTKQDLKKGETELEILKSQDEVELMSSRFAVRRAELDVRQNELISAIDARKNELTLEEAKRRLQRLESDIESRLQQREAELAVLREEIRKAELEVAQDRRRIENARVLTPMGGLVSTLENRSGRRSFGQSAPPVQEGDQVSPGMSIVQILDLSEMELVAKAEEVERARLREGQEAVIRLDALPGRPVRGKIKRLGSTASANFFSGEATKKFDCVLSVDMTQLLTHVGATPEQIKRILAGAASIPATGEKQTPRKSMTSASSRTGGGPSRAAREASNASTRNAQSSDKSDASKSQRKGGRRNMSAEDRQRARKMMQELSGGRDIQSMRQEERRALFQQMRARMGNSSGGRGGSGRGGQDSPSGGARGAPGGGGPEATPIPMVPPSPASGSPKQQFTAADRENARLPLPPKEGSDVEVLLRPGLLADAEVVIERIPDTLHVPVQAVFESGENNIVYIFDGGRLAPRRVETGRQTETRIAILDGLQEGETISLRPPLDQRKTSKKKKADRGKSAGPSFPGAGGGSGAGPEGARAPDRSRRGPR